MNVQKKPMSTAERQAKRQTKLKAGLSECIQLRADVKTAVFMLHATMRTMKKISLDAQSASQLEVAIEQAEVAIKFLDSLPQTHDKRHDD